MKASISAWFQVSELQRETHCVCGIIAFVQTAGSPSPGGLEERRGLMGGHLACSELSAAECGRGRTSLLPRLDSTVADAAPVRRPPLLLSASAPPSLLHQNLETRSTRQDFCFATVGSRGVNPKKKGEPNVSCRLCFQRGFQRKTQCKG